MTGDERDEDRTRKRDRDGAGRGVGFSVRASIRALRALFGQSTGKTASRTGARGRRRKRSDPDRRDRRESGGRTRTKRVRVTAPEGCLVETRRDDGAFLVTADVVGVEPSDLSVCIDHGADDLVIATGTARERVDLPWRPVEATDVWLNNGVLEVRLRRRDEAET